MISGFEQMMIEMREQAEKRGEKQGVEQGIQKGIQILTEYSRELGHTQEKPVKLVAEKYAMSEEEARSLVKKYWPGTGSAE